MGPGVGKEGRKDTGGDVEEPNMYWGNATFKSMESILQSAGLRFYPAPSTEKSDRNAARDCPNMR